MIEKKKIKCKNGLIKELTLEETMEEFKELPYSKKIIGWARYYEKDDVVQMARIGIMKAFKYYDISKNTCFITCAQKVIQDYIMCEYKKEKRQKRGGDVESISLYSNIAGNNDTTIEDCLRDENINIEDDFITKDKTKKISDILNTVLSNDEKGLIKLYFIDGLSMAEVAKIIGVTRQCISLRIIKIKKKLKTKLINANIVC